MRLKFLLPAVALAAALLALPVSAASGGVEQLRDPVLVFSTDRYVTGPRLAADPTGDVHLVFSHHMDPDQPGTDRQVPGVLMYARLHNGRWSEPTEIITAPEGAFPEQPEVAADQRGYLHLVWSSPDVMGQKLLYSRAPVAAAGQVSAWSAPITLDTWLGPGEFGMPASLKVGADDTLYVAYSDASGGIRFMHSADHGRTWSSPVSIRLAANTASSGDGPRLAVSPGDLLTVTWTEYSQPRGWPPVGVFTSRSTDGGASWSDSVRVAGGKYALLNVAAGEGSSLLRVWHGTVDATADRTFQWSTNGGNTWSAPTLISPRLSGGLTGFTAMATDSLGRIHVVTSVTGKQTTEEVWHTAWDGRSWTPPVLLSSGARGKRSVEMPALAISRGNQLHVVYEDDFKRIWYRGGVLDAPPLPVREVEPPPVRVPVTPEPTQPVAAAPSWTPVTLTAAEQALRPEPAAGPNPLFAGAASVVLLGLAVVVRRWLARP